MTLALRPEIRQPQRLRVDAAKGLRYHLALLSALRLRMPQASPDCAVIGQEGLGGAVGVVDQLDPAVGGQALLQRS